MSPEVRKLNLALAGLCFLAASAYGGGPPEIELIIRNHLFEPSELVVPAHTKIRLAVHNRDPSPEEFESWELNREKIIMGNSTARIFIGPLAPGVYPFFGEFHPQSAQGKIIVE